MPRRSGRWRAVCWPRTSPAYAALLFCALPLWQAVVFALLHQALFGLHLGLSFAPNHKGMAMPDGG